MASLIAKNATLYQKIAFKQHAKITKTKKGATLTVWHRDLNFYGITPKLSLEYSKDRRHSPSTYCFTIP
ncbi:surface lipoprotein assembly modifier [Oligella sp. MSHR50489EDL]|uniref:surface lipoprotein assembly modifier n=1 Tax=Oligella sp. MSHR50489EDL TaxID=3139409 RepID=UPI003D816305